MTSSKAVSDPTIALISIISVLALTSSIALLFYLRKRCSRQCTKSDTESTGSSSPSIKLETRRQTHADRKVFSWFNKVDADADKRGIFRLSVPNTKSVFELSDDEMRDLSAALDRLRGRDSVATQRLSMMAPPRASVVG